MFPYCAFITELQVDTVSALCRGPWVVWYKNHQKKEKILIFISLKALFSFTEEKILIFMGNEEHINDISLQWSG